MNTLKWMQQTIEKRQPVGDYQVGYRLGPVHHVTVLTPLAIPRFSFYPLGNCSSNPRLEQKNL